MYILYTYIYFTKFKQFNYNHIIELYKDNYEKNRSDNKTI